MAIIVNKNPNAGSSINGIEFVKKNGFMVSAEHVTGDALALFKSIPGFEVLAGTEGESDLGAASGSEALDAVLVTAKEFEKRALAAEQLVSDLQAQLGAMEQRAVAAEASADAAAQAKAAAEAAQAKAETALAEATAAATKAKK